MANDKERLVIFLDDTLLVLQDVIDSPTTLIPTTLHVPFKNAWTEFDQSFDRDNAKAKIRALSDQQLDNAGLRGAQASVKLSLFQRFRNLFTGNRVKDRLRKLLDAIDTLLESLIEAAGLGHALKEIKEAIKNALDLDED